MGVSEILRFALNDKKEALNDKKEALNDKKEALNDKKEALNEKCGWESLKVKEYGFESCDIGGVESANA